MPHLPPPSRPLGTPTRGTTAPNRLRRVDRWLLGTQAALLRGCADPLVVDLGYGAHPVTTVELATRLQALRPDVEVVGVEIDRARVEAALPHVRPGLRFVRGGFNLPLDGRRPVVVRALNVLRQYDEGLAADAWESLRSQLAPDGVLVEGSCDEVGRLASWVLLGPEGPRTLVLATQLRTLVLPSDLGERLPKALYHRNVPGEPVHALLRALDDGWRGAPTAATPRERWTAAAEAAIAGGWPLRRAPSRWRLGELELPWSALTR